MKLSLHSSLSAAILSTVLVLPSHGIPVIQGTDLSNPDQSVDFSEIVLVDNTLLGSQYAGLGLSFDGFYYNGCPACLSLAAKPDIGNFKDGETGIFNPQASVLFQDNQEAATFRFIANFALFQVGAYLDGGLVESFNLDGSQWGTYGFTGIQFDEIRFTTSDPSLGAFLIDNLAYNAAPQAIPEPSTWALFGMALAGLSLRVFQRQKKTDAA